MFEWLRRLFRPTQRPRHLYASRLLDEDVKEPIYDRFCDKHYLQPLFPWAIEINDWARVHAPEALSMPPGSALPLICSKLGIGPFPPEAPLDVVVQAILVEIRKPEAA